MIVARTIKKENLTPRTLDHAGVTQAVRSFLKQRGIHQPEVYDGFEDCIQAGCCAILEGQDIYQQLQVWFEMERDSRHPTIEINGTQRELNVESLDAMTPEQVADLNELNSRQEEPHLPEPDEIVIAKLDGECPRHRPKKDMEMEFGPSRELGYCPHCKFAYDFTSDD